MGDFGFFLLRFILYDRGIGDVFVYLLAWRCYRPTNEF